MATKKKVKAVEPEVVSSVEPEVAAVPMTMAAATPRANGQANIGFAKVEQGKTYVLSVNAPSGPGEVELLGADSDTQFEPDMFSLLRTKVENSMQIPFVAVSSWVYVQAPNSHINWLVTPANFSLAVPGVSSGGGESITQIAIKFSSLTKAEYNALETKSNSTIYFLTDLNMWAIGDKKLVTSDMPA